MECNINDPRLKVQDYWTNEYYLLPLKRIKKHMYNMTFIFKHYVFKFYGMIKLEIWIDWNSNNECLQSDCNYYGQHYKYTI